MNQQMAAELREMSRMAKTETISDTIKKISRHMSDEEFGRALDLIQSLSLMDLSVYRRVSRVVQLDTDLWKGVVPEGPITDEQKKALELCGDPPDRRHVHRIAKRMWREEPESAQHELDLPQSRFRSEFVAVLRAFKPTNVKL